MSQFENKGGKKFIQNLLIHSLKILVTYPLYAKIIQTGYGDK